MVAVSLVARGGIVLQKLGDLRNALLRFALTNKSYLNVLKKTIGFERSEIMFS